MNAPEGISQAAVARIRSAMDTAGINQESLVAISGISRKVLSRKLKREPEALSLPDIVRIADALGVSFEELAFGIPGPAEAVPRST